MLPGRGIRAPTPVGIEVQRSSFHRNDTSDLVSAAQTPSWPTLRKQRYGFGLHRQVDGRGAIVARCAPDSHAEAHPSNASERLPTAFSIQCRVPAAGQRPCRHTESIAARWAAGAASCLGIGPDGTALEPDISQHAVLLVAARLTHARARHAARRARGEPSDARAGGSDACG